MASSPPFFLRAQDSTKFSRSRTGTALAEVLSGKVSPSGRLPVTIPHNESSLPKNYLDQSMTAYPGRTHRYFQGVPLYPFGFGLEYSTFDLGNSHYHVEVLEDSSTQAVLNVNITNNGEYVLNDSKYVVNVFASPRDSNNHSMMIQMLVGFSKVSLSAGQTKQVQVEMPLRRFKLLSGDDDGINEFEIWIGSSLRRSSNKNVLRINFHTNTIVSLREEKSE